MTYKLTDEQLREYMSGGHAFAWNVQDMATEIVALRADRAKPTQSDAELWQDLCEKTDRTSPEGQPDMAIINQEEFYDYLVSIRAEGSAERAKIEEALAERDALLNSPHNDDWIEGTKIEAGHQVLRWGVDGDAGKGPLDWFWLIGYLAQKAAFSAIAGDTEKAKHHTISTAAALLNWHKHISGVYTKMRPGIAEPIAQPAESGETICVVCADTIKERATYVPTSNGPMHPYCYEHSGAKPAESVATGEMSSRPRRA
jgi:hypothetical protein